jgi:hypothetical protein
MVWWWLVAARSGDGADNSNSEEGNDLSDLHLERDEVMYFIKRNLRLN